MIVTVSWGVLVGIVLALCILNIYVLIRLCRFEKHYNRDFFAWREHQRKELEETIDKAWLSIIEKRKKSE